MSRFAGVAAALLTLIAGLAGGLAVSAGLLFAAQTPGVIQIGAWKTWPRAGAPDADPYARALFATRGELPLSPAEGLALHADRDSAGDLLSGLCTYRLVGRMPQSRIWTIAAYTPDGGLLPNPSDRLVLTSAEAIGGAEAGVAVSQDPQPGNWLPLGGSGRFKLVLRLYDTPLAALAPVLDDGRAPRIERTGCAP